MGWNTVEMEKEVPMLKEIKSGDFFYFVHSYYVVPEAEGMDCEQRPITGLLLLRASGRITSLPPSSTRRRVRRKGLKILETFARTL